MKSYTGAERRVAAAGGTRRATAPDPLADLQRSIGNRAVAALLQRDTPVVANRLDPTGYKTFGEWVNALPSTAWDDTAVNVTGEVRKSLPDLADLVDDLRADCADVTILLRHYYLQAHGENAAVPGWDASAKKPVSYTIGKGVSRKQLRRIVGDIGTIHFQEQGRKLTIVDWYVDAKKKPLRNLKEILGAGLKAGDLLVWKKRAGVKGNFSGHVQTVRSFGSVSRVAGDTVRLVPVITVVQGTMENGTAKGEIQTKALDYELLTGKTDGNGEITFQPGGGEEEFFGAGRWK